jgi:acyl carrier protein
MIQPVEALAISVIARHKQIDASTISPEADLAQLGISSLDAITIAYQLEEELGVEIPNEAIAGLRTVQDLIDGLNRLTASPT